MIYENLKLIVAYDQNELIGANNKLPWHSKEDLKHFKKTTLNNTVLMGRKTYESLPIKLENRKVVVLTKDINYSPKHEDVTLIHSVNDVLSYIETHPHENIFIMGGSSIYEIFLPYVDTLYITEIDGAYVGDSYFPLWNRYNYQLVDSKETMENNINLYFKQYKRIYNSK